jgi:threonine dehydrogenase-like Zn-dependent dehydrogenase
MKALVYGGDRTVAWTDVPDPKLGPGGEIVDVLVAGVCGTDLGAVRSGRPPIPVGTVLGHEFVGRQRRDGLLVTANPIISCGRCRACAEGRPHLCERREVLGVHRPGAFAQSVAVPAGNLRPIGKLDLAKAAMVEPIATALHAWRLSPMPASNVAVLGAGPIGMSLLHVLKAFAVRDVTVTDIAEERRALAAACGADVVSARASEVYDVVIDTVGAAETRRDAIERVRAGGTTILVGLHSPDLSVAGGVVVAGERTIRGSFAYTPEEFDEAIALAATLDTRWLASVSFDRSAETFTRMLAGTADPAAVKVHFQIGT